MSGHADTIRAEFYHEHPGLTDDECSGCEAEKSLDALLAEIQRLREAQKYWYGAISEAQRLDNTGGDSAVSVALCSWAEALAGDGG